MKKLKQFDKVRARFAPARQDDLKPGLWEMIGTEHVFQAYWIIEEGHYSGQYAMNNISKDRGTNELYWCPECDLEILEYLK